MPAVDIERDLGIWVIKHKSLQFRSIVRPVDFSNSPQAAVGVMNHDIAPAAAADIFIFEESLHSTGTLMPKSRSSAPSFSS
jgi:hypothetical protein